MGKISLVVGAGIGFVLGSRAGREPYEKLEAKVREFAGRPEVQAKLEDAKSAAKDQAGSVVAKATDKITSAGDDDPTPPAGYVPNADDAVSP